MIDKTLILLLPWLVMTEHCVGVPTEEQEQARGLSLQRETLTKERKHLQNVGTSSGLYYGVDVPPNWWKPKVFVHLCTHISEFLKLQQAT